jgi:myosin-5
VQINLQEFKAQEVAKLQNSLQEMKKKFDETNALLLKERENAIKAAIEVVSPITKEAKVLVEDREKIKTLKMEIEILKVKLDITF